VTARRALVPDATSSGLAAAGSGTATPLPRAARTGMMAEWPMMAARTGLDTTHGQPAASRDRCCWPRALGAGQDRLAIDLGCGEGTDALELLARGWLVLAVDAEPAGLALLQARIPPAAAGRIRVLYASFAEADCRART
jgi:SAM-dependent methyltransferase